jgi:hypothetical protein
LENKYILVSEEQGTNLDQQINQQIKEKKTSFPNGLNMEATE